MISFLNKATEEKWVEDSWLIIGKGPSFEGISDFDISGFKTLSLNHIVEKMPVDVAHITDWDVFEACHESVYKNARYLVMPLYPHINNRPGKQSLHQLATTNPNLMKLNDDGRLLWYNSSLAADRCQENVPVIPVRYFSADAAVALLAYSGVNAIRTIGIDGGTQYSASFNHLNEKTLLSNGQLSFDLQFQAIAETLLKTGATMYPLTESGPVKVYVGSQKEQMLAVKVLEYSIKRHTGASVDVFPMHESNIAIPMPKDKVNQPRTPFSFQRFIIPELNGHTGKAIYVDSDMQVFTDIRDLWQRDMGDADIFSAWEPGDTHRIPQYSVMLLDCEKLKWDIREIVKLLDSGELDYEKLMFQMKVAKKVDPAIEFEWNSLECYEEGKTKLLHYTDMNIQPWINKNNPLSKIWIREMRACIESGFITEAFLKNEIISGHVRPSLWLQYKIKRLDMVKRSKLAKLLDFCFVPPHAQLFYNKRVKFSGRLYNKLIYTLIRLW